MKNKTIALLLLAIVGLLPACQRILPPRQDLTMPTPAQADSLFRAHGIRGTVEIHGNVVELTATQDPDQLRRGGPLWARVGPFIYVFSPATGELFERYPGVAALRSRTSAGEAEVARVMLVRDTLRGNDWRQARRLLSQALREGTQRPSRLEELVRFGERFTTYDYNPTFAGQDAD